jgi:hypothetical protein
MQACASYLRASRSWHGFLLLLHHEMVHPPERLDGMLAKLEQSRLCIEAVRHPMIMGAKSAHFSVDPTLPVVNGGICVRGDWTSSQHSPPIVGVCP